MRVGPEYVRALRDGREIYLDGSRIDDVTSHPHFAGAIRLIADTYDRARTAESLPDTSYVEAEGGERFSTKWLIPRSLADLGARRRLHEFWARPSFGHMGRTPDHVASFITGFAAAPDIFARGGEAFAANVERFYRQARQEDLYLAYVIVPPQGDRSKPAHQQEDPHLYAGVAAERDDGIVLRGAQMIGTSAPMADYILLSYIVPLQSGDEDHAISVVIPCNAPGLRMYPRRPYASMATSTYDYPLSSRFDETDSLIVLHDVFVPWEHVFVYRDVALTRAQFYEGPAHVLGNFQALARFVVKLRFAAGLARRVCALHGIDRLPAVQGSLGGQLAGVTSVFEALLLAAESRAVLRDGVARPNPQFVYTAMAQQRQLVVDLLRAVRELCGGGPLAVPSSGANFLSAETGEDARRFYRTPGVDAEERVKILKLVWDFIGTEFAGRQLQYEMFYSAPQHVADLRLFHYYDWAESMRLVEECLAGYDLETDASS